MTEAIAVAIGAAIGAAVGAAIGCRSAFSRIRPRAPEATARAYRDLIASLNDLRGAFLEASTAKAGGQSPTDSIWAAMREGGRNVSRVSNSASFLIAEADLDLIDTVDGIYTMDASERVEQLDKVISAVRQSAYRTFRRN